jgi:hypothetical protein
LSRRTPRRAQRGIDRGNAVLLRALCHHVGAVFELRGGKPVLVASLGMGDRADGGMVDVFVREWKIIDERFGQEHSGACCAEYVETYVYGLRAGKLPASGDFAISVRSSTAKDADTTSYAMTVEIR